MDRNVEETMRFEPQQQQVIYIVPTARTSIGKKSALIQAVLPIDTP